MYYTYDEMIKISIQMEPYVLHECINEKLKAIKKELHIHIQEPLKKTIIHKQEDYCGVICKCLNKLSEKNYEKLKSEIFEMLESIQEEKDLNIITNKIFLIASSNLVLSKLFSKLYKELIDKNNHFLNVFQEHFQKHCEILGNILYVNPNVDYDGYCNYVRQIDCLKFSLVFFSNLLKENIVSKENIIELCLKLLYVLEGEMIHKEKMEYKEELLQSLFILIKETFDYIHHDAEFENIKNKISQIQKNPNCNPKLRFKCMDINEYIEKQLNK